MSELTRGRRRMIICGVVALALLLVLRWWVDHVTALPGDHWAAGRLVVHPHEPAVARQIERFFDTLATATIAGATVFAALVVLVRRCGWAPAAGLVLSFLAVGVCVLLKHLWGPTIVFRQGMTSTPYFDGRVVANYPSGHVTYAVAVFGYLAVIARRRGMPELAVIAWVVVVAMAPARVLPAEHLVSDAVGGYLLGGGWLLIVLGLEPVWSRPFSRRPPPGSTSTPTSTPTSTSSTSSPSQPTAPWPVRRTVTRYPWASAKRIVCLMSSVSAAAITARGRLPSVSGPTASS